MSFLDKLRIPVPFTPPPIPKILTKVIGHVAEDVADGVKTVSKVIDQNITHRAEEQQRSRLALDAAAKKDPSTYFVSQKQNAANPNEDVTGSDNSNCGPTSLLMVAEAFGKVKVTPAQADAAIEKVRAEMGANPDETQYTDFDQILHGSKVIGLDGKAIYDASESQVRDELGKGHKLIAHVDPNFAGGDAQHFVVVTKVEGDKVFINDPLDQQPKTMSMAEFQQGTKYGAGVMSFAP
jgi:hypothetical protein